MEDKIYIKLTFSGGRTAEYDIAPILRQVRPYMTKDDITQLLMRDYEKYDGLSRGLLLMKTGDILDAIIQQTCTK